MPTTDDPSPILVDETDVEEARRECQVAGCDRPGTVPRRIAESDAADGVTDHYVCRRHYRLFLGIKVGIAVFLLALLLLVIFRPL